MPPLRRPTDAELEILRTLWELGPASVRQVHERLARDPNGRGSGQTTVLKHMQIMLEKGLLVRDESVRPQIFQPAVSEGQTQNQLLKHLLDKAFRGSAPSLVMQALSSERASREERSAIRSLLDRMEPVVESDDEHGADGPDGPGGANSADGDAHGEPDS